MHVTRKQLTVGAILIIVAVAAYFFWSGKPEGQSQKPRSQVQTIKSVQAQKKSIPVMVRANGYVTAINTVEVRPQVQNVVRAIHVREGQEVKAGQLLFTLDPRSDEAAVANARAQLSRNRAALAEAEATLRRNQDLLAQQFISQAAVDTARSQVEALRGAVQGDEATIRASRVALGHNTIAASIAGRIGAISVRPGSLAQPTGNPMLTISQLDPIAVSFSVAEKELSHILASYPKGDAPVVAQLANGTEIKGKLVFIDNAADTQTGTVRMKAEFANADHRMWPGNYVAVRMVARTLPDAVVVPAQAVVTGPERQFIYVVSQDETVKARNIEVLTIEQGQAAVAGIEPGARVVVEGTQNLRPGSKVQEANVKDGKGSGPETEGGNADKTRKNAA
ncbi:RND family efflux transporter MFP subunit [Paucimonas lemoignei]|uniref:RND family efflux transporter MFP subunit n=1 Tax=Paucimonas lemoignei TaxID=29443 RepID=A0A4R3HRH9_PAULE|nr:efflux RND transporter periplasmic adaptor subunit [Paucimonas lemoignei]TCS35717.1 RND family efflux transporter MFP subunit [Paucimonas lemoignei]